MYTIYKLWNEVNDKLYIGQTTNLSKRGRGGAGYLGCPHLYHAIKKYGWEKFHYEILVEASTQEEANILEKHYIKKYDTTNPEKGYNLSLGGNVRTTNDETKEKISNSVKKLWKNSSYREHMSKRLKESWTPERREKQKQQIQKMRENTNFQEKAQQGYQKWLGNLTEDERKNYYMKRVSGRRKKVICLTTMEIFNSMKEACDKYHLDNGSLTKVCQGKLKHTGKEPITQQKLSWMYYDEYMEVKK